MKKRFIEWDMPLAEISEASAREKTIRHGHPSTFHIWWARRPLASSRATIFAALIDLPDDQEKRKEIKELIRKIPVWDAVKDGNSNEIKRAQALIRDQWGDNLPRILDPFAGGGSIPLEALRLGCETYASDLNPVAVFIEKALLEWPQKFGVMINNPEMRYQQTLDEFGTKINFLSYMVEKWAKIVLEEAKAEIGQFYPGDPDGSVPVGYLWARTIPCQNPSCGTEIPLIRQFWFANIKNKKVAYRPLVNKEKQCIEFVLQVSEEIDFDPKEGTVARSNAKCPLCGQITNRKVIQKLANEGKMGERMVGVILLHPSEKGKKYRIATKKDIENYRKAEKYLQVKIHSWPWLDNPIPDEEFLYLSGRFNIHLYGLTKWDDLFNIRQKLALITFMHKIRGNYQRIKEDCHTIGLEKYGIDYKEAAKAVSGYLAIILDRLADHNSSLNLWQAGRESMKNTFGRQSLPMVWDYAEVNPFSGSTGDWNGAIDWVKRVIDTTCAGVLSKIIHVTNDSAVKLSFPATFFDAVFTDPPYYDNVPYADLSDFFYVWLKRTVGDLFPNIFATPLTPKENEIVQLAKLNKKYSYKTKEFFEENLTRSFREINRVLKPGGIAVIVYAHRTTAGWETMLNSLINAGLVVTASWPIHTEMKSRLIARASATLASSIYMVCRKLPREKIGFYNELQPLVEERIRSKLQQFWDAGIAGGDFFVSAIGPAMEIFSKFERIEKYSGEAVRVTNFLKYIRTVSTRFIVDKLLKGTSPTEIDKESQFYLTYRWTYLDNRVEFSDARKLAIASGVNLEELWDKNGFVQKSGSNISVLGPNQRKTIEKSRNMVDIMHQTVLLWEKGKRDEIDELMTKTGHKTNPAFWQFCQAVAECLLMGNKEKQLLEGFLLGKDNYMRDRRKDNRLKGLDQFLGA